MQDLDALLARIIGELKELRIPVSGHIDPHVQVNERAIRLGCCVRREGSFLIELNHRLLDADELACLRVLAHEVLHTCPHCQNHGPLWRQYARQIHQHLGYEVTRTVSYEELGLGEREKGRYLLVCQQCGAEIWRMRATSIVLHPEHYRCRCGGRLERRA